MDGLVGEQVALEWGGVELARVVHPFGVCDHVRYFPSFKPLFTPITEEQSVVNSNENNHLAPQNHCKPHPTPLFKVKSSRGRGVGRRGVVRYCIHTNTRTGFFSPYVIYPTQALYVDNLYVDRE